MVANSTNRYDNPTQNFVPIAHRGYSFKAPENTLAAFQLALEAGFTNIELDVQLSKDGFPIVFHDKTLERTTNGKGRVCDWLLKDLQKLDCGSWFDLQFKKERIPTLSDVLTLYKHRAHLHIELKSGDKKLIPAVIQEFRNHDTLTNEYVNDFKVPGITITSFNIEQLIHFKHTCTIQYDYGWLVPQITQAVINTAKRNEIKQLCPSSNSTPQSIRLGLENGFIIRGYGVKSDNDINMFITSGAKGATTNWPIHIK